ncbi:MAG: class I SAM-dependent methyltransferase [Candidatus Pacebacteria bacterium]|nr:class I SAM-dependent methyltransferase [Candidatus Paceibacterota bacterium]
MIVILRDLQSRQRSKVIEFGGGESTLAIAALLKTSASGGTIETIEHDSAFAEELRGRLARAALSDIAAVNTAPLRHYPAQLGFQEFRSYDLAGVDLSFDVAFVDGPIVDQFGAATRLVPLRWCMERMKPGRAIYLDDAARQPERDIVSALKPSAAHLRFDLLQAEKGLLKISMQSTAVG